MALYSYQAYSKDGKKIKGTLDAPSEESVRQTLQKMGVYPTSIEKAREEKVTGFQRLISMFSRGVSTKDKILFTKQLSVLLKAGVPLLQAVELLIEQFSGKFRQILVEVKDGVREGQSLADGLSRYPKVFESIYVQLVRAGEATGNLEIILERLTEYLERRQEITSRIKSALRYPIIQLCVIALVVSALLTFIVPQLLETFEDMQMKLPFATRLLMGISTAFTSYWYVIILCIIAVIGLYRYIKSTNKGALWIDQVKLKLPIVGYFARYGAIVQFCRTLGILLAGGVNLSQALDIVVSIIDNKVLANALMEARDKIIKQGRIADFLEQTKIFPPIAIYLIKTGEKTGQLDVMLTTVAQMYETDLTEYSDNLSSLIEPIMLIVMALVVGFVILAIMWPMFTQMSQLGNIRGI